jgi:hypothetical protein
MTDKAQQIKMGRPSDYTPEIADEICTRLANGESLRAICGSDRDDFMPSIGTVLRWVGEKPDFQKQYARAREIQAETHADDIVTIADGKEEDDSVRTARDRLRVDARKWVASKLLPKKYGEAVHLKHSDPDGGAIQTETKLDLTGLTADQLRALASIKVTE